MSSIQSPYTSAQYQMAMLADIAATGISQFSAGGKARAFVDTVADQLGQMETRDYLNLGQTLLPFATGKNLDFLGALFGVPRLAATTAQAQTSDTTFIWYVRSGTFGDINNGQPIVIPANVRITNAAGSPVFLSDPVTLPATASSQAFSASCATPGAAGNSPKGQLISHNFTGYAESLFGSLLVTNQYGIVGGTDTELDENYRTRINLELQSPSGANEAALRFAILQVPGVQDIVFEPMAGSVNCYVFSVVPQPAASLLLTVQQVAEQTIAFPNRAVALAPDLVGISLSTSLKLPSNVSSVDQDNIISTAQAAVENYIDNLGNGTPLIINQIPTQIFNSDSRILDVGQPNNEIPEILVWRSRPDGSRYSRYLIGNYQPALGERIVVETNPQITTPVNLTIA